MYHLTNCLLLATTVMAQLPKDSAAKRLEERILARMHISPSSAEYILEGQPSPVFFGRDTTCRCYTESDGTYYVEETCESWTSSIWFFKDRLIWRYEDSTAKYAFVSSLPKGVSPEKILEKKGFIISRMTNFDKECANLLKAPTRGQLADDVYEGAINSTSILINYYPNGFNIRIGSTPKSKITYRVNKSLPSWKKDTDALLNEIENGQLQPRKLDKGFSFMSVMSLLADEFDAETKIPISELPNVSRVNGYLIPVSEDINIQSATSSGRGQWLTFVVKVGMSRFECAQYQLEVSWTDKGDLAGSPFTKNSILKSIKINKGILLLDADGAAEPATYYVDRSGQTIVTNGNHFEDEDFRKMIRSLR